MSLLQTTVCRKLMKQRCVFTRDATIHLSHDSIRISIQRSRLRFNALLCWTTNTSSDHFKYFSVFRNKQNNSKPNYTVCCTVSKYILVQNVCFCRPLKMIYNLSCILNIFAYWIEKDVLNNSVSYWEWLHPECLLITFTHVFSCTLNAMLCSTEDV